VRMMLVLVQAVVDVAQQLAPVLQLRLQLLLLQRLAARKGEVPLSHQAPQAHELPPGSSKATPQAALTTLMSRRQTLRRFGYFPSQVAAPLEGLMPLEGLPLGLALLWPHRRCHPRRCHPRWVTLRAGPEESPARRVGGWRFPFPRWGPQAGRGSPSAAATGGPWQPPVRWCKLSEGLTERGVGYVVAQACRARLGVGQTLHCTGLWPGGQLPGLGQHPKI
jgi:hypothetical protein